MSFELNQMKSYVGEEEEEDHSDNQSMLSSNIYTDNNTKKTSSSSSSGVVTSSKKSAIIIQKLKTEIIVLKGALDNSNAIDIDTINKKLRAANNDVIRLKQLNFELKNRIQNLETSLYKSMNNQTRAILIDDVCNKDLILTERFNNSSDDNRNSHNDGRKNTNKHENGLPTKCKINIRKNNIHIKNTMKNDKIKNIEEISDDSEEFEFLETKSDLINNSINIGNNMNSNNKNNDDDDMKRNVKKENIKANKSPTNTNRSMLDSDMNSSINDNKKMINDNNYDNSNMDSNNHNMKKEFLEDVFSEISKFCPSDSPTVYLKKKQEEVVTNAMNEIMNKRVNDIKNFVNKGDIEIIKNLNLNNLLLKNKLFELKYKENKSDSKVNIDETIYKKENNDSNKVSATKLENVSLANNHDRTSDNDEKDYKDDNEERNIHGGEKRNKRHPIVSKILMLFIYLLLSILCVIFFIFS